ELPVRRQRRLGLAVAVDAYERIVDRRQVRPVKADVGGCRVPGCDVGEVPDVERSRLAGVGSVRAAAGTGGQREGRRRDECYRWCLLHLLYSRFVKGRTTLRGTSLSVTRWADTWCRPPVHETDRRLTPMCRGGKSAGVDK